MAEEKSNVALKKEDQAPERRAPTEWEPFESLRRQIDRMFEDFGRGFGLGRPFGRSLLDFRPSWPLPEGWGKAPAVDVCEREKEFEITAELPGMDASNIDVKLANGVLTIKGEKKEEKEEKEKDYYISERRFGSFQRSFELPEGIDEDKIQANFEKGLLTIKLPRGVSAETGKEDRDRHEIGWQTCPPRSLPGGGERGALPVAHLLPRSGARA